MKCSFALWGVALAWTVSAGAQPVVKTGGVVNSASYTPAAISGGVAQGSLFNVFGSNLGPAVLVGVTSFPLQSSLGGTSIKVSSGSTTADALMIYTVAGQLAAILPSTVPAGAATLTVTYNGQTSEPVAFQVAPSSFGAYALNQAGSGPGIFTSSDYKVYGLSYAAQPRETVTLWGTGVGPVSGAEAGGPLPGDLPNIPVEVYVGGLNATIAYRGRSGCCAGVDQIAFVVPDNVLGCHVPVAVKIGDVVSNFVSLAVASGSRTCSDPAISNGVDLSKLSAQANVAIGSIYFFRNTSSLTLPAPIGQSNTTTDTGGALFFKYTAAQLNSAQNPFNVSVNNFGACSVYTVSGDATSLGAEDPFVPVSLDAGVALTVNGPNGTKTLPRESPGNFSGYYSQLGGDQTFPGNAGPLYLSGGAYKVTGPGGVDVGPINTGFTVPPVLDWTNESSITTVNRSQGQLVTWTGGDPAGVVEITGSSYLFDSTNSTALGALFTCTVPTTAKQFTIPPVVLLSLPPSQVTAGFSGSSLGLSNMPNPVSFSATGIDAGFLTVSVETSKNVTYQ